MYNTLLWDYKLPQYIVHLPVWSQGKQTEYLKTEDKIKFSLNWAKKLIITYNCKKRILENPSQTYYQIQQAAVKVISIDDCLYSPRKKCSARLLNAGNNLVEYFFFFF